MNNTLALKRTKKAALPDLVLRPAECATRLPGFIAPIPTPRTFSKPAKNPNSPTNRSLAAKPALF